MAGQRVVLITGASSGLGLAMARDLHTAGYRVYGTSRSADGKTNPYGAFELIRMDVVDDASVTAGVEQVAAREGGLDAVICNAGFGIAGAIEDTSSEDAIAQFDVNFFGVHRVCRAVLPHLRRRERSHLVVIGSLGGLVGMPFQGLYSASKHALEGYAASLRIELRGTAVRVTIIEPGDFATGFTAARQVVAAAGEGSEHQEALKLALERISVMEGVEGADPRLLGECVASVLAMDRPPLRVPVGAPSQVELVDSRHQLAPEELEDVLAEAFGLDAPPR